jgi:hypothetical protein
MTNKADTRSEAPREAASFPVSVENGGRVTESEGFKSDQAETPTSGGSNAITWISSNSGNKALPSATTKQSLAGIDHLTLSFQVRSFDHNRSNWDRVSQGTSLSKDGENIFYSTYTRSLKVASGGSASLKVSDVRSEIQSIGKSGKLEFNPSRIVDPSGHGLATLEEAIEAFLEVLAAACEVVEPFNGGDMDFYKINRVDIARDFHHVRNPASLIRSLAPLYRRNSSRNVVYSDPKNYGAQTLEVGTKWSGHIRLYDKFVQTGDAVEPGTVRWELEAKKGWAKRFGGLHTMSDLLKVGIDDLAQNRWKWSAMGTELTTSRGLHEAVERLGLKKQQARNFFAWLVSEGTESAWTPSSRTLTKYRRFQDQLGVVAPAEAPETSHRLDWETGAEVTHDTSNQQPCEDR